MVSALVMACAILCLAAIVMIIMIQQTFLMWFYILPCLSISHHSMMKSTWTRWQCPNWNGASRCGGVPVYVCWHAFLPSDYSRLYSVPCNWVGCHEEQAGQCPCEHDGPRCGPSHFPRKIDAPDHWGLCHAPSSPVFFVFLSVVLSQIWTAETLSTDLDELDPNWKLHGSNLSWLILKNEYEKGCLQDFELVEVTHLFIIHTLSWSHKV